jgi:TRAP-type C4-dicarboxylate transport system substrate-binding protein
MSREKGTRSAAFISFLTVLVCLFSLSVASAKTITLSLADSTAPAGLRGEGLKAFVEEVEKHTNGQVKIQVHWSESLLKSKEILAGIKDGIVDIGYLNPNYYPKQMMISGAFALFPQGPSKFTDMAWFYAQAFEQIPALKKELESLNLKPIYTNTVLPLSVVSTKPFTSFEDFQGKRIRAASRWWLGQLEGAGAVPVSIPWGDVYMALQTGTIEGVYTNLDGIHRTKLDEVAPHVYTCRELWIGVPFIYAINKDKWNSLDPAIQTQMIAAGEAAAKRFEVLHSAEWDRVISEQQKMGCTITPASPEDINKWISMPTVESLQNTWVEEAQKGGLVDAADVLEKMKALLDQAIARSAN